MGTKDRVGQKGLFVKVNMDGVPIERKVELKEHGNYADLSATVDKIFRSLLAAQRDSDLIVENNQWSTWCNFLFRIICSVCCCDECKNIQNLVPRGLRFSDTREMIISSRPSLVTSSERSFKPPRHGCSGRAGHGPDLAADRSRGRPCTPATRSRSPCLGSTTQHRPPARASLVGRRAPTPPPRPGENGSRPPPCSRTALGRPPLPRPTRRLSLPSRPGPRPMRVLDRQQVW